MSSLSSDPPKRFGLIVSLGLVIAIISLAAIGIHRAFTSFGEFIIYDFQSPLIAARAVVNGIDPYSEKVTAEIQAFVYGRSALATEDALAFAYPVYVAYLMAPLTYIPLAWAQSIWLSILLASALAGVFFCIKVWSWPRKPSAIAIVLVWSLTFYPIVWALVLGQIALLAFVSLAAGIWAMLSRRDLLAGLAFGLSLIKPNLSFVPIVAILIFAALTRRFRLLSTALITILVLFVVPMNAIPDWPISFARRLTEYVEYTPFVPPVLLIGNMCCKEAATAVALLLGLILVGTMVYGWRSAIRTRRDEDLLWALGITLIMTVAVVPRFATVNQIILLLPAIGIFDFLSRKGLGGALSILLLMAFWGIGLWILAAIPPISDASPRYPVEHRVLSPILPASMAILWITIRWRQMRGSHSNAQTANLVAEASDA